MILKEFRELTKDLPGNTVMFIDNEASEWYGTEAMALKGWTVSNCDLIYNFEEYEAQPNEVLEEDNYGL